MKRTGRMVEASRLRVEDEVQWRNGGKIGKVTKVAALEDGRVEVRTAELGTRVFASDAQVIRLDPVPRSATANRWGRR